MNPRRLLASTAVLLFVAAACVAQEVRVTSVTFKGISGDELSLARRAVRVRGGDVYSEESVEEDYIALLRLPFVLSGRALKSETPEGIAVVFEMKTRGKVAAVRFTGNRKFKDKKLEKLGQLTDFQYYDLARLTQARELILAGYKKKGYLFAKADFATQDDGSILFTIAEGRRLKVKTVNILGNISFSEARIKKEIRTRTRKAWFFSYRLAEDILEDDRLSVRDFYRERGHLDADVKLRLNLDSKRTGIIVDFLVTEGPRYSVRTVEIYGNETISTEALLGDLQMKKDSTFSPDGLNRNIAAIQEAYGIKGYIDAVVRPVTLVDRDTPQVDISFRITEGQPVYINEVEIFGNDKTRDNVLRREMKFYPGELFNSREIRLAKERLERLGHFAKVEVLPFEKTDDPSKRNVIFNVEETYTGRLLLGAAVNSNSGLTGQIMFSQRNFDYASPPESWRDIAEGRAWVGAGQTFELNAMPGTEYSRFSMSYRDPRVSDSDYSLGLNAQRWERDRNTYSEKHTSGGVSVGKAFSENAFWEVSAEAGTVKISGIEYEETYKAVDPANNVFRTPTYLDGLKGSNQVNTLGFTLGHDTRDSFVSPTTGHRMTAKVEGSSGALASDFEFLRLIVDGRWYKKLSVDELERPHVLAWRGRAGVFIPKDGSTDSPVFERFFLGGTGEMRGFAYRGVRTTDYTFRQFDEATGLTRTIPVDEAVGGEFMATGGVEYEFPLQGESFRGAFFYDLGVLLDSPGELSLGLIRQTVGFGLRIQIPPPLNFPIALDFGFPVMKEGRDETQVISFSFGRNM